MKPLLIAAAGVILLSSCHKTGSSVYMNTATINGPSLFMTSCGGAYWITIDGVSARTTFNSLPTGSGIDLATAAYPVKVKLNWHYQMPNTCNIVVIDAIQKVN